jgi:hypothetical protein
MSIDFEYRHDDLEEADLIMMTSTATDRDDRDDDDEYTLMEWKFWSE